MKIKINKNILREIFYFLTATVLLLVAAEIAFPNSVLSYLDINWAIVLWFFSWILLL
jgi:hypothetical protein